MKLNVPFVLFLGLAVFVLAGCTRRPGSDAATSDAENSERASRPEGGSASSPESEADSDGGGPGDYDAILQKYVRGDHFDYEGLKSNPQDLARFERFLDWQADADLSEMSRNEQIAFYINAYNACCIKAILDHYPVDTPKEIDGFFDGLTFTVAGEELTISEIEYERLIADYRDMRAHFAVVCADRGCLPLKPSAYTGTTLNEDLQAAAKRFVNDPRQFQVDRENKVVRVSKIFEWYGEKFLKDPERPVGAERPELYLTYWTDEETDQLLKSGDYKLTVMDWDWTLNEKDADPEKAEKVLDESK